MAELGVDPGSVPEAVSWCIANGALYALPAGDAARLGEAYAAGGAFAHAPFALAPFPWPKAEYEKVRALQPELSLAVDRASRDEAWLAETLKETMASDAFTAAIFKVHVENPNPQPLRLGLFRSDYMLDEKVGGQPRSLQVEINTIASSFACLSQTISRLHAYLAAKRGEPGTLPANEAGDGLAAGIAAAHRAYLECRRPALPVAAAMVVQPGERNQMDQRKLEHCLFDDHGLAVRRLTLKDLADRASLDADAALVVDGVEITVVYYRAGYSPDDYPSDAEWTARAVVERSLAVKCPSAAYQLAGTKKVQQALAAPGVLEKFTDHADPIRAVFAGLYDLDEAAPDAQRAVDAALAAPERFVLKPQREGGGNNLYGDDLKRHLQDMSPAQRAAFILMERIVSLPRPGALVRNGVPSAGDCVAELGIYSAFLADGPDSVRLNQVCGHLLRQKLLGVDEGGVAAGFAVLSSPKLV